MDISKAQRRLRRLCAAAALCLCLALLTAAGGCSCDGAQVVAKGTVDGVIWTLDSTGCLSFTGSGAIPGVEYILDTDTGLSSTVWPEWFDYRDKVTDVKIGREISNISMNAFLSFERLCTVDISSSVGRIDGNAFSNCTALEDVTVRGKATTLERYCIGYSGSAADSYLTGVTFHGVSGSTIERYAQSCGASFRAL